jgi:hypothetical protein
MHTIRSDIAGALKALLTDYPFGADHDAAKVRHLLSSTSSSTRSPSVLRSRLEGAQPCPPPPIRLRLRLLIIVLTLPSHATLPAQLTTLRSFALVLNSTKSSDIPAIVKQLDPEQQDGLMKFIYKGMERSDELELGPSVLLGWHEKVRELRFQWSQFRAAQGVREEERPFPLLADSSSCASQAKRLTQLLHPFIPPPLSRRPRR